MDEDICVFQLFLSFVLADARHGLDSLGLVLLPRQRHGLADVEGHALDGVSAVHHASLLRLPFEGLLAAAKALII